MTKKTGKQKGRQAINYSEFIGKRIRLKPFEGNPEEFGILEEYDSKSEVAMVTVDKKYREDKYDDGLREVDISTINKSDLGVV